METVIKKKTTIIISESEIKVVQLLSDGATFKEVASKLKAKIRWIDTCLSRLRSKYSCENTTHLVATFLRQGIIK